MALFTALCVVFAALSLVHSQCSDTGSLTNDQTGFVFTYARSADYVNITAYVETDTWVAIGFSADMMMPVTDVGVGARVGDDYFLDDRYNPPNVRILPVYDTIQDFTNEVVDNNNGIVTIRFTRPVSTGNSQDLDLDECRYVLWAFGGAITSYGTDGANGVFGGHSNRGVFASQICLCSGVAGAATVSIVSIMFMLLLAVYSNMF